MPTEDFLARLVKSKAAGASIMMPSVGIESGPEAVSKAIVSSSGVVDAGTSEVAIVKGKDKKRHRDGHSSKNSHSKRLKDSVSCPASEGLILFSEDGVGTLLPGETNVVGSGSAVKNGLHDCKSLVDKLSVELEKLLKIGDPSEVVEVVKLREEVRGLKELNESLEEGTKKLAHENKVAADKLFASLTEKSELITECDTLSGRVKSLELENQTLKEAVKISDKTLSEGVNAWSAERAELVAKMEDLSEQLAKCQAESLSSFEEGYGEGVGRFAKLGIDVAGHTFDCYLADVTKGNGVGKTGSSDVASKP